jgi:hypothetical protein
MKPQENGILNPVNDKRSNEECVDLYIYRMAERKSIKIGNVTKQLCQI